MQISKATHLGQGKKLMIRRKQLIIRRPWTSHFVFGTSVFSVRKWGDFPGGPVVKTLPSDAGGAGLIAGVELRSHMPRGHKTKT